MQLSAIRNKRRELNEYRSTEYISPAVTFFRLSCLWVAIFLLIKLAFISPFPDMYSMTLCIQSASVVRLIIRS